LIPDFVNNTSPWAETENGKIGGLNCDTYGGNASLPVQYFGSNEAWPDVWPWVYELIDGAKFLINATTMNYTYDNGNITINLGGLIDPARLATMGHSTGGSMAIVAAMVYKWFKLAVAYAPYDDVLSNVYWPPYPSDYLMCQEATPLLIMVGSRDVVTPKVANAEQIYNHASTPKMIVDILNGSHMYFCDSEDIFNSLIEPLSELPITTTPTRLEVQQNIAINFTSSFLNFYFKNDNSKSPYTISDDTDNDGRPDINKSYEFGSIIKITESHLNTDLSYTITTEIVPLGIGWGNSTVIARFYDILQNEADFSPVVMEYQYGTYFDQYAGRFKCRVNEKSYYFSIETIDTAGKSYKSGFETLITR
jgi:hypothetical protein